MKIKEGFLLREVDGMGVVVPVGRASREFNGMITLNKTGVFLWNLLQTGVPDPAALTAAMAAEYGIDDETASRDVAAFLNDAREAGILEE